ncbi:MAG: sigma-70 family RNA polymerase sigma factor [Rhodothermaceae bacterium]|nr:sigma-70 family RNA polymerase sigma factor [Rhodothermaceae bacterium]
MSNQSDITQRLNDSRNGDEKAMNEVFEEVYDSLRIIAHNQLGQNKYGNTLNTTALVHEAYVKLVGNTSLQIQDRTHFFSLASRAMRYVLVDYARSRSARKRGGHENDVTLDPMKLQMEERSADLIQLDEALTKLVAYDENLGRLVELRFFGGLTYEEIAEMEGRSVRTIKRDWQRARTWIFWVMKAEN